MVCVKVVGFQKLVWNVGCCFYLPQYFRRATKRQVASLPDSVSALKWLTILVSIPFLMYGRYTLRGDRRRGDNWLTLLGQT